MFKNFTTSLTKNFTKNINNNLTRNITTDLTNKYNTTDNNENTLEKNLVRLYNIRNIYEKASEKRHVNKIDKHINDYTKKYIENINKDNKMINNKSFDLQNYLYGLSHLH